MDSAIGLSTMLAIGPDNFRAMLDGFHEIDEHFRTAPFERNLPVLMGLLGRLVQRLLRRRKPSACCPYEQYLKRFPAYLQQLTMESNGKHVTLDGDPVTLRHRPDLLGRARHQRPALVLSVDPSRNPADPLRLHRVRPVAESAWASITTCCWRMSSRRPKRSPSARHPTQVSAEGTPDWLVPHRVFEGNRPSNTILVATADAGNAGQTGRALRAQCFTQGAVWNIDSFDQWGVELGKVLAQRIIPELEGKTEPKLAHDSSTNALIRHYRKLKELS